MEKYYQVLGLPSNSSNKEVQIKYKQLSKQIHPDRGGNNYLFNLVNEAYNQIINKNDLVNKSLLQISSPKLDFFKDYFGDMDELVKIFDNTLLLTNEPNESTYYSRSVVSENVNGHTITKEVINNNGIISEKYY